MTGKHSTECRTECRRTGWFRVILLGGLASASLPACARQGQVPVAPIQMPVKWANLAVEETGVPSDGYRQMVSERTRGLFPGSLCVARVALVEENDRQHALVLASKPEVDFLPWNSVFDDLRSISEVFPLNRMAMDGAPASVESVLNSARALVARVCLVYGEVETSPSTAEIRGVLLEVPAGRVLAIVRAVAQVDNPLTPEDRRDLEYAEGWEERVPRVLAVHKFEAHVRDCLLALMANDDPVEPVAPDGWVPQRPLEPAIWPPLEEGQTWPYRRRG